MRLEKELLRGLKCHPEGWQFRTNDRFLIYKLPDFPFGQTSSETIKLVRPVAGLNRWAVCFPWGLGQVSLRTHLAIEWMRRGSKIRRGE